MRVKSVSVRQFKRFHHLDISEIPEPTRLVVMIGPNGCGKSSVFDAFATWYGHHRQWGSFDPIYHGKKGFVPIGWNDAVQIDFHQPIPTEADSLKRMFYIRSAYRNEPEFNATSFNKTTSILDDNRMVKRLIENDVHVSANYQQLVATTVEALFDPAHDDVRVRELRERLIGQVRQSMQRVFDDLLLASPGNPFEDGCFFFEKGTSKHFHYSNLSGGEKAAFDLILDLVVKRVGFNDTVFCIDEPETHMNTKVQHRLLGELFRLIPDPCQLWISTHSIGMMRQAKDLYQAHPEQVALLDFHNASFDAPVTISPSPPSRTFWRKALEVALDDMATLIAPAQLVLCEGRPQTPSNPVRAEFDASCYRRIFAQEYPDTDFLSVGNSADVQTDRLGAGAAFRTIIAGTKLIRLIDRDERSPEEVSQIEAQGVRVLKKRHLEAYLLDDEILTALCVQKGQPEKAPELLAAKQKAIADSVGRTNAADDIKSASGSIYNETKRILGLTGCGNSAEVFCRDTITPLLTTDTLIYQELKRDIFGGTASNRHEFSGRTE